MFLEILNKKRIYKKKSYNYLLFFMKKNLIKMSKKEDFDYQYKSKINIIFIKVILIGDAKVGKTSFIVRFF